MKHGERNVQIPGLDYARSALWRVFSGTRRSAQNQTGGVAKEDLVKDGWTDLSRRIRSKIMALPEEDRGNPLKIEGLHGA